MTPRLSPALLLALLLPQLPVAATADMADTALEIMQRVDARDDGDNRTARLSMTLVDRHGQVRQRSLATFTRDQGPDTQSLMFFLEPANVRDTGFLTHDYRAPEREDDQWLYLPELGRTKRIAGASRSQSFMGTDFSYADMTRRSLAEWEFGLRGEHALDTGTAWVIEALPASPEIEQRYGYTRSLLLVDQERDMVLRAVHWLPGGGDRLKYLDLRGLQEIDGIWTATELEMRLVENGELRHRTLMQFQDVRYGQALDDDLFTLRQLERGP